MVHFVPAAGSSNTSYSSTGLILNFVTPLFAHCEVQSAGGHSHSLKFEPYFGERR